MRSPRAAQCGVAVAIVGVLAMAAVATESPPVDLSSGDPKAGKAVAMDRSKGNCIACHLIIGGESPGSIGPALIAMKTRYPTIEALAAQVWDPTVQNPEAVMPPFGKHQILSQKDFVDVVAYVWSL